MGKRKTLNLEMQLNRNIPAELSPREIEGLRQMNRFRVVAVGGTFDELHKGHKTLLMTAFEHGENVLIGLCTDE
ncbi:MAG: adenylyltransferase/cytidyltransferase family protein, partial [Candidatus Bathyarchaeia archaeon]